jgi:hypothetical protein
VSVQRSIVIVVDDDDPAIREMSRCLLNIAEAVAAG